jgi:hypothetical protein
LKKLMLMASMLAMVLLAASPALAQSEVNDLQCVDFANSATQGTAQATYDADPSDPNGLDADGDGIACEFTESAGEISYEDGSMIFVTTAGIPAPDGDTGVQGPACAELGDSGEQAQQEAQALLNQDPSDPNGLDADGDGVPCEFTESAGQLSYEDGSVIFVDTAVPPQDGDTSTQATPQDYSVQEDGTVIVGSDVGTDCRSFALSIEQGFDLGLTQEQIQSVLAQCEQVGNTTDDQYGEQPAPEQPAPEGGGTQVLPDTGGTSVLALGVGALLVTSGLLVRRIVR